LIEVALADEDQALTDNQRPKDLVDHAQFREPKKEAECANHERLLLHLSTTILLLCLSCLNQWKTSKMVSIMLPY
jgi:hypothetical protein